MEWVSFDEIKKAVTLAMVINRYGWQLRPAGPHVLRGRCPLPTHSSGESKESFIATLDKGAGGAWSCHSNSCASARGGKKGGNAIDLVAAMEGCSIREAALKMQQWFSVPNSGTSSVKRHEPAAAKPAGHEPKRQLVSEKREGEPDGPNKPLAFALKSVDPAHPYFKERGITEETAREFGAGFFPGKGSMAGRVVFAIHNGAGEIVAYAGRSIDGTEPRYKFPAGFKKSLELFNFHRVKAKDALSVVVVEGFFDCMKVTQAGYGCVALMGSAMSQAQEDLLADNFAEVILMLDGDEAGRRAVAEIGDRLGRRVYRVISVGMPDGGQPDQMTTEEVQRTLSS